MRTKIQYNNSEFAGGHECGTAIELGWVVVTGATKPGLNGRYGFYRAQGYDGPDVLRKELRDEERKHKSRPLS
jgi:hypothetical protein